jgi:hypothetical protein
MKNKYDDKFSDELILKIFTSVPSLEQVILCGVKWKFLEIQTVKIGEHMILLNYGIRGKTVDGILFMCMGPLLKISVFGNYVDVPYIVGGDFNIFKTCARKGQT